MRSCLKLILTGAQTLQLQLQQRGEKYFQITAKACVLLNPDVALFDGNLIIVDCDEYNRCYELIEKDGKE